MIKLSEVRLNSVVHLPGFGGNDKFVANVSKRIPMRRWGQPEDFAAIAIYIMSTASSYHTAETFLIDGGYANF